MAGRYTQQKQLLDKPDEKNYDATQGCDYEGENKTVEWRIYPAKGHISRGEFHSRELDHSAVFVFQENIS